MILERSNPSRHRRPVVTPNPHKANAAMWRVWKTRLRSSPAPFRALFFEQWLAGRTGSVPRIAPKDTPITHAEVSANGHFLPACPQGYLEEAQRAIALLRSSATRDDPASPLVCYMNRSDAFTKHGEDPKRYTYRNAYVAPLETALANSGVGGTLVRVGQAADDLNDPSGERDERFLDYASSASRSAAADIGLLYRCDAYVGADSGPAWLPLARGVPVALTDMIPFALASPGAPEHMLVIIRLIFSHELGRVLRLSEMVSVPVREARATATYSALGLEPVPNTVEDIAALLDDLVALNPRLAPTRAANLGFDREFGDRVRAQCVEAAGNPAIPYLSPRFIRRHERELLG